MGFGTWCSQERLRGIKQLMLKDRDFCLIQGDSGKLVTVRYNNLEHNRKY